MPRSVNHVASKAKRTKILKLTKGYYGARKNVWTVAKNTWEKGLTYAYRDRFLLRRSLGRRVLLTLIVTVVTRSATSAHCGSSVSTLLLASMV